MIISWCENRWLENGLLNVVNEMASFPDAKATDKKENIVATDVIIVTNDSDVSASLQNMSKINSTLVDQDVLVVTDLIPPVVIGNLLSHARTLCIADTKISISEFSQLCAMDSPCRQQRIVKRNHHLLLSPQEKSIMMSLCIGLKPKDMTRRINMSIKTISYYKRTIMSKLGIGNKNHFYRFLNSITYSDINNYL